MSTHWSVLYLIAPSYLLDNARYQKCALGIELAQSLNIELLYLTAYSPNLNLIERLWKFVKNFQEHPQSSLLTDSIRPVLQRLHPDGQYCIGQDCRIYWRLTDPPEKGAEAPDWFYVPNVPPMLKGVFRRS